MSAVELPVGFIPLVDAAPLVVAHEMGFAAEEGLRLDLRRATSWSSLRDMLTFGRVAAAHMLAPVPVAMALGLGSAGSDLVVLSVLSVNGNVIGVSRELAARLAAGGHGFDFDDATAAGRALIGASASPLRIGVPFPFSMHAELVYYWLNALGLPAPAHLDVRTVPPPLMTDALQNGEIDAFCVGEPWGSQAVESGVAALLLPGRAIWSFAPEKVLAVRRAWATEDTALASRLVRTVWRAGRWLDDPGSRIVAAELLARPAYLDLPAELIDRALSGTLIVTGQGQQRDVPNFLRFHAGTAGFPWRSQAQWIARQLAGRTGLNRSEAMTRGAEVFRSDLYRSALRNTAADLPGASAKLEGANADDTAIASGAGTLILPPNRFFDGWIFDPLAIE